MGHQQAALHIMYWLNPRNFVGMLNDVPTYLDIPSTNICLTRRACTYFVYKHLLPLLMHTPISLHNTKTKNIVYLQIL